MKIIQQFFGLFFLIIVIGIAGCEKKSETVTEPFVLESTWNFDKVATTNALAIGGNTDEDPTGFITFNEDGSGISNFSFDAVGALGVGIPVLRNETFTWVRNGRTITITKSDENTENWEIENEINDDFQLKWTQAVAGIDALNVHAFLIP